MAPRARAPSGGHARQRDTTGKLPTHRLAEAEGEIRLGERTRKALRDGTVEKGDPLESGALAGLAAMKHTADLLPHCHVIPLTSSEVHLVPTPQGVRVRARAQATWATGVEMEALVGATVALLTVWDMVKHLEKDAKGQYPITSVGPVRVVRKVRNVPEPRPVPSP